MNLILAKIYELLRGAVLLLLSVRIWMSDLVFVSHC